MSVPLPWLFAGLLAVYLLSSAWNRLDYRYPFIGAVALLIAAALIDALGLHATAGAILEYVLLLFGGGVVLLIVDFLQSRSEQGQRRPGELTHTVGTDSTRDAPQSGTSTGTPPGSVTGLGGQS